MKSQIHPEIVTAATQGDAAAIDELLRQCQPSVTQFARKYCATPEDVEDAVQLTLWVIYRKVETLKTAKAFVSWAFKIVRNQCYRLLKGHQRDNTVELTAIQHLELSDDDESTDSLRRDVVTAIAHLPAHYRQVLVLRDMEGLSAPEVAEQLGLTLQTVKSRLHRGRNLLREALHHWVE